MSLSLESSFLTRTIIAKVSGLLSMVGSGLIIHDVVSRWRRRKGREALPTVSRVILSMSLADLGSSFIAHFIGTWMVPSGIVDDSSQIPLAAGNEATCIAQAFISSVFILSGASSNGSLALAYWLTICHGKREHELKKWNWQLFLVYLPWIWGVMDGSIGVALGFHNYNRLWYCDTLTASNPSKTHWRPDTAAAFLGIVNLLIVLSMFALIKFVHSVEKKTDSHRRINDPRSEREKRQTIQVTQQGIWFILAYMAAWWPAIIALIMYEKTPPEYVCFISAMYPLQGAFNALVYFRPKYIAERQRMISTSDSRVSRLSVVLDTMNLPRMSSENLSGILPKTPTKRGRHQEDPPLERNEHDVNDDVDIENGGVARSEKDKLKTLPRIDENS